MKKKAGNESRPLVGWADVERLVGSLAVAANRLIGNDRAGRVDQRRASAIIGVRAVRYGVVADVGRAPVEVSKGTRIVVQIAAVPRIEVAVAPVVMAGAVVAVAEAAERAVGQVVI